MAATAVGDLLELVVELMEALDAARTELAQLEETAMPLGDRVLKQLEERDALKATIGRLIGESSDPSAMRRAAEHYYRQEAPKITRTDDGAKVPVSDAVKAQLDAVMELLRRRALVDADLAHALDGALLRSAFAGC